MPWIQYSRNFEDVMLCRALQGVERGCFVDVGASHPVNDSNTYALYQRGWRGIAVDALSHFPTLWAQARPQDVFVEGAVGAAAGERDFYVVPAATQVSTLDPAYAEGWRKQGYDLQVRRTPVTTLDAILERHLGARDLHLLCIDVEGAEREVLAGLDLGTHRPWLVVVEATVPGTPEPAHQGWEPLLLDAEYEFAYFDGLNRFYVAAEYRSLKRYFALPPNIWDDFVSHRIAELEQALAAARGAAAGA